MILLIISILAVLIGIRLMGSFRHDDLGFILTLVFGAILLFQCCMFGNRYSVNVKVEQREAFRMTLNNARANGTKLENATILKDVAEWNQWIVGVKMDNEFWFDMYIPDSVDTLTPLK